MVQIFENWFNDLTDAQQKAVIDHVFNKHIKPLNEGIFTGPSSKLEKGVFTGPTSSQSICPTCKRLL